MWLLSALICGSSKKRTFKPKLLAAVKTTKWTRKLKFRAENVDAESHGEDKQAILPRFQRLVSSVRLHQYPEWSATVVRSFGSPVC